MEKQKTIKSEVKFAGIGVHTGNKATIVFKPAPADFGVKFYRSDFPDTPPINADITNVTGVARGTTIGCNGVKIHTVEHVLAALMGFGIDNLIIELDANEPPVGDGSSVPFVEMIRSVGVQELDTDKRIYQPETPIYFSENGINLVVLPDEKPRISFTISYGRQSFDTQYISLDITEQNFIDQIAPSRTFCFYHEVEALMRSGLIKGGSLDNAVVIKDEAILSKESLRFPNEFVRHKVLDLMGDLFLLNYKLNAHIIAVKSGHETNIRLTKLLKERIDNVNTVTPMQDQMQKSIVPLNIDQIMKILPHRYPFLLVDKIVELEENKRIVGIKNVSMNEQFFNGHFPGRPIMPGVLIVEALAQTAGILILRQAENQGKYPYFMSIDKVKFRKPVLPGDQIRLEAEVVRMRSTTCQMQGRAYLGEELAAEALFMCSLAAEE